MRIFIVTFLSFVLLVSSIVYAQNEAQAGEKKSLVMKTTAGKVFDLNQKKGKVVMIAFWASWCTICKIEMNHINDLYSKYNNEGLEIIGVNVDGKLGWGKDLKYPIAIMDNNYSAGDFGFPRSVPLIYIVGKDGVIAEKLANSEQMKIDTMEVVIKNLLQTNVITEQSPISVPAQNNIDVLQEKDVPQAVEKKTKFNFKAGGW